MYVYCSYIWLIGGSVGPGSTIIMFKEWGDTWGMIQMRNIIIVAMGIQVITGMILFKFDDKYALNEAEEDE